MACEAEDFENSSTSDQEDDSSSKKCKLVCPHCPKSLSSQSNLNRHVKNMHPESYVPSHNSIDCPKCDAKFTRLTLLSEHLEEKHDYLDGKKELLFPSLDGKCRREL